IRKLKLYFTPWTNSVAPLQSPTVGSQVDPDKGFQLPPGIRFSMAVELRSERWKKFLERLAEFESTPNNDLSTGQNKTEAHLEAAEVQEKDGSPDELSECDGMEEVGSAKGTTENQSRVHQAQIWAQIRPSLSAIEQMMSHRVKKKKFMEGGEQVAQRSRTNLAPIEESRASEDSDDEFYDVERSELVHEASSGDEGNFDSNMNMASQGIPEETKEELECLVRGGLPMALRGEVFPLWQAFVGVGARRADGYYNSLLGLESKTDAKEVDAPLKADNENKPIRPPGTEKWKGQIEKVPDNMVFNIIRTLMGIIDDYFDGYYSEEMIESQVICHCMNHLDYLGVQVAWVTGPWFLSIFVNMLPWESGPAIVTTKDAGDAVTLLQSLAGSTFDSSQLVLTACMGYQPINEMRLQDLRNKHRPSVLAAMEERSKGLRVWRDSKGLATKLYSFKRDNGPLVSEAKSKENICEMNTNGDVQSMESDSAKLDGILGTLTVDAELDSLPDLKEQATWLKVELCRLLEEKRSATLRAEELETALMEMVKQDNRRILSAKKTAAKKSPPCEVLICGSIPRFSNRRRFRQSSRGLTVRGWHRPRFSLFLLFLPSS
ncbi:hypothetical protein BHE74_00016104, partial [Ensete ventricosum]